MTHAGTAELPDALWRNPEPKRAYDVVIVDEDTATYRFLSVHRPGGEGA